MEFSVRIFRPVVLDFSHRRKRNGNELYHLTFLPNAERAWVQTMMAVEYMEQKIPVVIPWKVLLFSGKILLG